MSDDAKTRQARYRRHRQGDHSSCTRRCKDARPSLAIAEVPSSSPENIDPAVAMEDLARLLMVAYQADPSNCALARELRSTLLVLRPGPDRGVAAELAALGEYLQSPGGLG